MRWDSSRWTNQHGCPGDRQLCNALPANRADHQLSRCLYYAPVLGIGRFSIGLAKFLERRKLNRGKTLTAVSELNIYSTIVPVQYTLKSAEILASAIAPCQSVRFVLERAHQCEFSP